LDETSSISLSGHVQGWTVLMDAGDPGFQLHPATPQASAV